MTAPPFGIQREGSALLAQTLVHLTGLRLSQLASAPAQLELTWQAGAAADLPRFDLGESLAVTAGRQLAFSGRVAAIEVQKQRDGHHVLHARAYDGLDALRSGSRARALEGAPFARLLGELCAAHSIAPEGFEGADVATGAQSGRTDFELLRAASAMRGCYFQLDGQRLVGFRLRASAPSTKRRWNDFWTCRCERNTRRAQRHVRVSGSTLGQTGSFAARAPTETNLGRDDAEQHHLGVDLHSDAEAEGLARALADRAWASSLVFHGTLLPGDLSWRPGSTLEVVDAPIQTRPFVLTQVTHVYDPPAGGLRTELTSAPLADEPLGAQRAPVLVGEVREIDERGRVRVHFATHDALSGWLRVVVPGAGEQRGLGWLPDVGDAVVVLTPDGDPLHGVVLGGVWEAGPADAGVSGGRRRRAELRLGQQHLDIDADRDSIEIGNGARASVRLEKHHVSLDAAGGTLTLSNGQGSRIELGGSTSTLTSAVPLVIEAPGQSLTIRAARIDFEQA